jgi:hypothetical protein
MRRIHSSLTRVSCQRSPQARAPLHAVNSRVNKPLPVSGMYSVLRPQIRAGQLRYLSQIRYSGDIRMLVPGDGQSG